MKMRRKSFPVRSWHRASRKSHDPHPSTASLPGEANEGFGYGASTTRCDPQCASGNAHVEVVPDTFVERNVPHKKRHWVGTSDTGRGRWESLDLDACMVCDVSDERVSRCSGIDCVLSFHGVCLDLKFGKRDDLANDYCPYCWFKILALKHKSVTEKAAVAKKARSKYLDKEMKSRDESEESVPKSQEDTTVYCGENGNQEHSVDSADSLSDHDTCSSEKEQVQVEKDSDQSSEKADYQPEEDTDKLQVITDKVIDEVEESEDEDRWFDAQKFQDAEDDETPKDQTKVNTGAGEKGDVSPLLSMHESLSGTGSNRMRSEEEEEEERRRRLILNDIDSEIPLNESTTQVALLNTVRNVSFFTRDHRRRIFWTSEEEEMLKVGVEKFAAEAKKNMPWRKILAMGEKVFHETRTPANLKDKWRNMIRGRLGEIPN